MLKALILADKQFTGDVVALVEALDNVDRIFATMEHHNGRSFYLGYAKIYGFEFQEVNLQLYSTAQPVASPNSQRLLCYQSSRLQLRPLAHSRLLSLSSRYRDPPILEQLVPSCPILEYEFANLASGNTQIILISFPSPLQITRIISSFASALRAASQHRV